MERVGKVFGGDCRGGTVFGGSSVGATTPNIVPPSLDEKKRERQDSNRNVNVSHIHEHLLKTDDGSSKLFMEEYESQQAYNTNLRRAPDSYRSTDYGLSIPRDKPREITSCSFSSTNHKKNATREVSQFLDEAQQCEDQTKGSNRDFHLLQSPPRRPSSSGVLPGGSAVEKETEERNASINSKTLVGRLFAGERELRGRNLGSSDAESSAIAAKTQQHLGHKSCLLDEAYENKEGVSSSSLPNMFCTATRGTSGVLQEAAPIYDVGPRQSNIGSDGFLKKIDWLSHGLNFDDMDYGEDRDTEKIYIEGANGLRECVEVVWRGTIWHGMDGEHCVVFEAKADTSLIFGVTDRGIAIRLGSSEKAIMQSLKDVFDI